MKIDTLKIDRENFIVIPHVFNGETVFLVNPKHEGVEWNKDNLIFRSSVWNEKGLPVSLSYKKFFNHSEKPDLYPDPEKHNDWVSMEKIDGSTLLVSNYGENLMVRTRGTIDASQLEKNGFEIELLKKKFPKAFNILSGHTYVYEWVSPNNRIVEFYPEMDLYLTNIISHLDYSYAPQKELNAIALEIGVKRPKEYGFKNLIETIETVKAFKGVEGICLYYKNDSQIVKFKGDLYCKLHRLKSQLASITKILDLYLDQSEPSFEDFYNFVKNTLDFEIAEMIKDDILKLVAIRDSIKEELLGFEKYINDSCLREMSRKDAAIKILQNKENACVLFKILDNKTIETKELKKMYIKSLEKEGVAK